MTDESIVIEDLEDEDEPGPSRKSHKPNACRSEAKWFQREYQAPKGQVVDCGISTRDIHAFQDLLWNHPHDRMVPGYGMTPCELGNIPADGLKGWLVSSHFFWMSQCLNRQQTQCRFFVFDSQLRKESIDKLLPSSLRFKVTTLILVMSVGRQDDGTVFFGTDKMQGDHWAVSVIDIKDGSIYYCDTLGWAAPGDLASSVVKYTRFAGLNNSNMLSVKMAHEPNDEHHFCTDSCTNYPLQKCSDVCGVVAIICIAVAALDKKLFEFFMQPLDNSVHLYLREPTEYSDYLRYVIMTWLVKQYIDIKKISLRSDYNPHKPLSKVNITCAGIKRKSEVENDHQPIKRLAENAITSRLSSLSSSLPDKVSACILQHASQGASPSTILRETVQVASKKQKEESYWTGVCEHLTFNNSIEICRDPALSISEYYQEFGKRSRNPIMFYNMFEGNHTKNNDSQEDNDIVLVVQTDYQREMLKSYCKPCICVDWTRKCEERGIHFNLFTLLVFVEGKYEVPVAWLITNKSDPAVQKYLFAALEKSVGNIETDIFVGDIAGFSYRYWINHFKKPKRKMFCMWEVVRSLEKRVKALELDERSAKEIIDCVKVFQHISDKSALEIYVKSFLDKLKPISTEFHHLLRTKYFEDSRDESWASCYRVIPVAKFVPFLQPFDRTLQTIGFFENGQMERIDVFFHKLMQFIVYLKRKLYIMESGVKKSSAVSHIKRIHVQPVEDIDFFHSVSGDEWYAKASHLTTSFSVLDSGCDSCKCSLRCEDCNICIHKYVCTCTDYLALAAGCKHIHLRHVIDKLNSSLNGSGCSKLKRN